MSVKPYITGASIFSPSGAPFVVRGPNVTNSIPGGLVESDLAWIASKGFNGVRIVVYWSSIEPTQGNMNWTWLDNVMNWCQKYNLWSHIDLHQWEYSSYFTFAGGIGFPAWLLAAKPTPAYADSAQGQTDFSDDFFLKRGYGAETWAKFVGLWQKILTRYKGYSNFWVKEILNEPLTGAAHAAGVNLACYERYREIIPIMNAIDPLTCTICHDVFYSSQSAFVSNIQSALTTNGPLGFPNLAWSRSYYVPYEGGSAQTAIDSRLNTLKSGVNNLLVMPHIISESGLQPAHQASYSAGQSLIDDRYRALLNVNGSGAIYNWLYGKGVVSGWQGPRNTDGTDSWMMPILATWLTDGVTPVPVYRRLNLNGPIDLPWTVNGVTYTGNQVLTYPSGTTMVIETPHKTPTTIAVTQLPTTITANTAFNMQVRVHADVPMASVPVHFYLDGVDIGTKWTSPLVDPLLTTGGYASWTYTIAAGPHTLKASYLGDATFDAATLSVDVVAT